MFKLRLNQQGFSLAEVVIAATILTAVGVTVLRVGVSARASSPLQMYRSEAQNLARTQMEELNESVRQDRWDLNGQGLSLTGAPGGPVDIVVNGQTFRRQYAVTPVNLNGAGGEDYRRVVVTVDEFDPTA